ncbi:MAG: D-alanine--D-alanine ligase [Desulfobacterales bacterium]|nr:D-alanine--D-alanine ligase [Desulfobacterales bacterium]MCP4163061.1 D-alanine--D-alanine ligase [Deltaproteobacteria bacterium]
MEKLTVALLSGGISSEREVSINSGNQVFKALDKSKYDIRRYDPKTDLKKIVEDADEIDFALLILHGPFGEDGTIQGMLDLLNIPYQGSGVIGSSVAMNKVTSKQLYIQHGLPTPSFVILRKGENYDGENIVEKLNLPIVVKPVQAGSSVGMSIVKDGNDLSKAIDKAFDVDNNILLEEYIKGTEFTCGVLGNDEIEALPVIEIIPGEDCDFFDYEAKYVPGKTEEICPARISDETTKEIMRLAIEAHKCLVCKGYSRTDFLMKDNNLYILETNTIPGMTATSLLPQSANVAGYSFSELLDKLIQLGIEEYKKNNIYKN